MPVVVLIQVGLPQTLRRLHHDTLSPSSSLYTDEYMIQSPLQIFKDVI